MYIASKQSTLFIIHVEYNTLNNIILFTVSRLPVLAMYGPVIRVLLRRLL